MLDEIFFLGARADAALAAARLMTIGVRRRALDITGVAYGDQHLRVGDQVFELDLVDLIDNLRAPIVAVSFLDFVQLCGDNRLEFFLAGENFPQLRDLLADRLQFLQDFIDRELREAMQLQFEDRVDLSGRQAIRDSACRFRLRVQRRDTSCHPA